MESSEQVTRMARSQAASTAQQVHKPLHTIVDNRPSAIAQQKLQNAANQGMQVKQLKAVQAVVNAPVIQRVKYIWKSGRVLEVDDDYKKKPKERWSTKEGYDNYIRNSKDERLQSKKEELQAEDAAAARREADRLAKIELERVQAARRQERQERFNRVSGTHLPRESGPRQIVLSDVVKSNGQGADLLYRGMSVNNIHNMQSNPHAPVFTVMNPDGRASPLAHVVDDDKDSPYLSFEARNPIVSGMKYAPKPVDPLTRQVQEVHEEVTPSGTFLKQEKSYTDEARARHADEGFIRIGYVGGIRTDAGEGAHLDISDQQKADAYFQPPVDSTMQSDRSKKASILATADREVLVKPGRSGIGGAQMPFVASVKEVDQDYYEKHLVRQTPTKALGFLKPSKEGAPPTFVKMQIKRGDTHYKFNHRKDLLRKGDDSEDEMSDNEDMTF